MTSPRLTHGVIDRTSRGVYSIDRYHALQQYQQHTSIARAISVCVLTPMPALAYLIVIEACLPLAPIEEGWTANPSVAIRFFTVATSTAFCMMDPMRTHMPSLRVTSHQFILPAFATSSLHTGFILGLCAVWVFPIPFVTTFTSGAFTVFFATSISICIGVKPFRDVPDIRRKLSLYLAQLSLLNFLIAAYPAYGAFYRTLHGTAQTASLAMIMLLKLLAKKLTAMFIHELDGDDFVPTVTQFSVELLHSLSVTTCVQTTTKPVQVVLVIIIFDFLPLVRAYRAIRQLSLGNPNSLTTKQVVPCPESSRLASADTNVAGSSPVSQSMRRALHTCENHLLMEYIECFTPCFYAIYVSVLFFLPNARFYDPMKSIQTIESLHGFLASVGVLVALQGASVVVFSTMLSRRALPSVSTLHQLSFVLETQRGLIQCWLFAWIPFCILSTVQHGGMDFTLRFEWMKKPTTP